MNDENVRLRKDMSAPGASPEETAHGSRDVYEQLTLALQDVGSLLDDPKLEPQADAAWHELEDEVTALLAAAGAAEVASVPRGASLIERLAVAQPRLDKEDAEATANGVAELLGESSVVARLAGRRQAADELLETAVEHSTGETRALLQAARNEPRAYQCLVHGRYLLRGQSFEAGDRVLQQGLRGLRDPALRTALDRALSTPRPLKVPPTLFTFNGIGTMLYGARDRKGDGSYVTTLFAVFVFLPLLPLASYRVRPQSRGGYVFMARERLSTLARVWRVAAPLTLVVALALGAGAVWLQSPEQRLARDLARAQELEATDRALAVERYEALLDEWLPEVGAERLAPVAEGLVRTALARVPRPLEPGALEAAEEVMGRFASLPIASRQPEAAALLSSASERWIGDLSEREDPAAARSLLRLGASLEALNLASSSLESAQRKAHAQLARHLAEDWPLDSLAEALVASDAAFVTSEPVAEGILREESALLAHRPLLFAWCARASSFDPLIDTAEAVMARIDAAEEAAASPQRQAALRGEPEDLEAWLSQHPGDQRARATLADHHLANNDLRAALVVIEGTPPGLMTTENLQLYGGLLENGGRFEEADHWLSAAVSARVGAFKAAARALDARSQALREQLTSEASLGNLPSGLERRLERSDDGHRMTLFGEWLETRMAQDDRLTELRARFTEAAEVVPLSLQLGRVKLRRAASARGDARARWLAEAERVFLDVQAAAAGTLEYQLGLGEVYHRLGRREEGDEALSVVLEASDEQERLMVASIYRGLGLTTRARATVRPLADGTGASADEARVLLSLMSELPEDRVSWLEAVSEGFPRRRELLNEAKATVLLRAGHAEEAGALFRAVGEAWERDAETSSVAANNAAVAYQSEFECTGDLATLETAVALLERAFRLQPTSSLTAGNLAHALWHLALLSTLDEVVDASALMLDLSAAERLARAITDRKGSAEAEHLLSALTHDPRLRRVREVAAQEAVLAPDRASSYATALRRARLLRDERVLRDLADRAEARTFDRAAAERREEQRRERIGSVEAVAELTSGIERRRAVAAEALGSPHSEAAAQLLFGDALAQRAWVTSSVDDVDAAIAAYEEAIRLWPELEENASEAWVQKALLTEPSVGTRVQGLRRDLPPLLVLDALLRAGEAAPFRSSAPMLRAGSLRRGQTPRVSDRILGQALDDRALAAQGRRAHEMPVRALSQRIHEALDPDGRQTAAWSAVFQEIEAATAGPPSDGSR